MDQAFPGGDVAPGISPEPFRIVAPAQHTVPMVFTSPHSGRDYPPSFLEAARLDPVALRRSEDCFVDQLFGGVAMAGAPLLVANFARAYCDANREPWELDPAMFDGSLPPWVNTTSARVGAGLGTLARVVATGETIYRRKLVFGEAEARVRACWEPYHAALQSLLTDSRARFGGCLLVDCHSMPAQTPASGRQLADIVLGDAHGTACAPAITDRVEVLLTGLGFRVHRNEPYAGGYITRHYGRPRERIHALQIELARALYMDEAKLQRTSGFAAIQRKLSAFSAALAQDAGHLLA